MTKTIGAVPGLTLTLLTLGCSNGAATTVDRALAACEEQQGRNACAAVCLDARAGLACPDPDSSLPGYAELRACLYDCSADGTQIDCGTTRFVRCSCAAACLENTTPELQDAYAALFECWASELAGLCGG